MPPSLADILNSFRIQRGKHPHSLQLKVKISLEIHMEIKVKEKVSSVHGEGKYECKGK
ncbi:hypothetical protein T07_15239 [Trichinella nelsoni]|uniref:Uncharacterized protein n=1 Tax=Trichinella nelsoni TaxID=6336 RepID=A0A0V0RCK2_9BILA|nr:hypothetical protein T07_15239 [Trichinella nelsoni]